MLSAYVALGEAKPMEAVTAAVAAAAAAEAAGGDG